MDVFFCNPSYPLILNHVSSFSNACNGVGDSIFNLNKEITSAQEVYDFFFTDTYQKQLDDWQNKSH